MIKDENGSLETYRAVYLTAEDLRVAASILYNAYHDDPFLWIYCTLVIWQYMSKN